MGSNVRFPQVIVDCMNDPDSPLHSLLRRAGVLPVVTADSVEQALAIGHALRDGGLTAIELTLRTPSALDALAALKAAFPELAIGAGTVLQPAQVDAVSELGADFIVTPGTSPKLREALAASPVPVLPGAATPSELLALAEAGFGIAKLFPATAVGGLALVKALQGPLPHMQLCPTGGIDASTASDYLTQPNVICIGGSWMVPSHWIAAGNFDRVREAARQTAALVARNQR